MVNNLTLGARPVYNAPHKRIALWTPLVLLLVTLVTVLTIRASANPPSAAEVRIQGLVNELEQERLTAQRHAAQQELEAAGEQAVPALLVALRSDNVVLRRNAADLLGFIASPNAVSGLQYSLANDTVPAVRRNAAYALGEVNTYAAAADLRRASVVDSSALVRQSARDALARMQTRIALSAGINERQLNAFAVAPSNTDTIYAASGRTLKVTQDSGKNWRTLNNALPSLANQIAVSPDNATTMYAAVDMMGMYKSVDGGETWQAINEGLDIAPGSRLRVSAITIDPAAPQHLIIATGAMLGTGSVQFVPMGLMTSHDGGATWRAMQTRNPGAVITQLAITGNQLYILVGENVLVYRLG